jgi:hypothetical protein
MSSNSIEEEKLFAGRGSCLRKNNSKELIISFNRKNKDRLMIIHGSLLITKMVKEWKLKINPNEHYMVINIGNSNINLKYNHNVSEQEVVYDPYKYEYSRKQNFDSNEFVNQFSVPNGYIDFLSKWYSIKFTYPKYNLIYVKPEMGISIQVHTHRTEEWEILGGRPIVINDNKVYYFAEDNTKFKNERMQYHSIINPNKNPNDFVILKEQWSGSFDEDDIKRIYNPNNYQ